MLAWCIDHLTYKSQLFCLLGIERHPSQAVIFNRVFDRHLVVLGCDASIIQRALYYALENLFFVSVKADYHQIAILQLD
jgi:hypothetical protein